MRAKVKDLLRRVEEEMSIQENLSRRFKEKGDISMTQYADGKYGAYMVFRDELEEILNSENKIS